MNSNNGDTGCSFDKFKLSTNHLNERTTQQRSCPPTNDTSRSRRRFIKGPIYFDWYLQVQQLPGKVPLELAMALKFQQGLTKSNPVRLTTKLLDLFGLKKRSVYDALILLEEANLISVERKKGRCRCVTILDGDQAL
ncbi:MAG: hypothetical protein ACON5J_18950 [Rubripirellula sp.]